MNTPRPFSSGLLVIRPFNERAAIARWQQRDGVGQQRCTGLEIVSLRWWKSGGGAAAQALDDGDDAHLSCRVARVERFETFGSVALEHHV